MEIMQNLQNGPCVIEKSLKDLSKKIVKNVQKILKESKLKVQKFT